LYDFVVTDPYIRSRPPAWGWYPAWALVGAGAALSLLGALTIGMYVAPFVVIGALALAWHDPARPAATGLICGLAVPPLWVAYLNREGPGTICATSGTGQSCVDEWSPWPWVVVAVVLIATGVVASIATRRAATRTRARNEAATAYRPGTRCRLVGKCVGD
jgi:hypothetical protein